MIADGIHAKKTNEQIAADFNNMMKDNITAADVETQFPEILKKLNLPNREALVARLEAIHGPYETQPQPAPQPIIEERKPKVEIQAAPEIAAPPAVAQPETADPEPVSKAQVAPPKLAATTMASPPAPLLNREPMGISKYARIVRNRPATNGTPKPRSRVIKHTHTEKHSAAPPTEVSSSPAPEQNAPPREEENKVANPYDLTDREVGIVQDIMAGMTKAEMATTRNVGESQITGSINKIHVKAKTETMLELALKFMDKLPPKPESPPLPALPADFFDAMPEGFLQVIKLMCKRKTNKEIAWELTNATGENITESGLTYRTERIKDDIERALGIRPRSPIVLAMVLSRALRQNPRLQKRRLTTQNGAKALNKDKLPALATEPPAPRTLTPQEVWRREAGNILQDLRHRRLNNRRIEVEAIGEMPRILGHCFGQLLTDADRNRANPESLLRIKTWENLEQGDPALCISTYKHALEVTKEARGIKEPHLPSEPQHPFYRIQRALGSYLVAG